MVKNNKFRYSVLCYIMNNYENVHEIEQLDPEAEYIMVVDDPTIKSNTWKVIFDKELASISSVFDRCYAVRFNLFKYASTPICIYMDANIQIHKSLKPMIDTFVNSQYDMCMMPHPFRFDFISEYNAWITGRNYPVDNAKKFFKLLTDSRYPLQYKGFFQGCFKIVKNDKINADFDSLTLSFLRYLGSESQIERLDQTVYSFVLNNWFYDKKILPVSEQILRSDFLTWYWHKSNNKNLNWFMTPGKPDIKWMFNRQVECAQLLDGQLKFLDTSIK